MNRVIIRNLSTTRRSFVKKVCRPSKLSQNAILKEKVKMLENKLSRNAMLKERTNTKFSQNVILKKLEQEEERKNNILLGSIVVGFPTILCVMAASTGYCTTK